MNILFLCVANSARSQMAEGLAKSMLDRNYNIQSAGSMPGKEVHPQAFIAMNEIGIDISKHKPKSIDDLDKNFLDNLDYVIGLCKEEACPILNTNAKYLHWLNEDPANKNYNSIQMKMAFTKTRGNLYNLIKKFFLLNNSKL